MAPRTVPNAFFGWTWSAVLAGVFASLVVQILLTMLGFGIGLLAIDVPTAQSAPASAGWAAFVWWAVSGIIAAFIGGAVAAANRALDGFGPRAYGEVERLTEELPEDARADIRAHYLGFPYWDATVYPARALSDVGELDEVQVVRVSPLDTHRLVEPVVNGVPAAKAKLRGVALGHFGAFFKRSWRENDYLWGRLDGAERLLWLIGDTSEAAAKEAFAAIAADESPSLTKARPLLRRVEQYVQGDQVEPPLHAATST